MGWILSGATLQTPKRDGSTAGRRMYHFVVRNTIRTRAIPESKPFIKSSDEDNFIGAFYNSDVFIACDNHEFKAHEVILSWL